MAERFPLFHQSGDPVVLVLQDVQRAAAALSAKVSAGAYELPVQTVGGNTTFDLFDQPLQVSGEASARVRVHAADEALDPFGTGDPVSAPKGTAYADLDLSARVGLAGSAASAGGSLTLSAKLAADGEVEYRHLLPVQGSESRGGAFRSLTAGSRLPSSLQLTALDEGEVHRYSARLGLSLDLEAVAGRDATLKQDVSALTNLLGSAFDGVSGTLMASVDASFKATLGLALSHRIAVTVGRAGTLRPARDGWVRVRIQREHQRKISAGATFALQIRYSGAAAADAILDRAFSLLPLPRLVETFEEISGLLADGDWDAVKGRLSAAAQSRLAAWLDDTGWKEKLAGSPEIQRLVEASAEIVDAYQALGPELQSFYDRLLGEVDLGPGSKIRSALSEIAGLDADGLRQRLVASKPELAAALDLLQTLTGSSLEELVLSSDNDLGRAVDAARGLAGRGLAFLARLDALPGEALARIQGFARSTGIASVVSWLAANATSVQQLEGSIDQRLDAAVASVVERLTGKAFDQLGDAERQEIQMWAGRLHQLLDTGELEERLRAAAAKLDGELGFSLAFELERLTRRTALLDLEFDPTDTATRQAVSGALRSGAIGEILKALPDPGDDDAAPYLLRECVFLSRRVRSSAVSLFFTLTGLRSSRNRWVTERSVRVTQVDGGALSREGTWEGGFVRSEIGGDADLYEAGAWIGATATGEGGDLAAPYGAPEVDLRLTLNREDEKTGIEEIGDYMRLLGELGFEAVGGDPDLPALAPRSTLDTRFALSLRLPGGVGPFVAGVTAGQPTQAWGGDFLAAAGRWWDDPLATRPSGDVSVGKHPARLGRVLAALLGAADFRQAMLQGPAGLKKKYGKGAEVDSELDGQEITLRLFAGSGGWRRDYVSVPEVSAKLGKSYRKTADLAKAFTAVTSADGAVSSDQLDDLSDHAAAAFAAATGTLWSTPTLAFWLALTRLSRLGDEPRAAARGLALLRWRDGADQDWSEPVRWVLGRDGLPALKSS